MDSQTLLADKLRLEWERADNDKRADIWRRLPAHMRDIVRDLSDLTPQLVGLEGKRVEVEDIGDWHKHRFWVGRSTGWRPCHIEVKTRRSSGGCAASKQYRSVRVVAHSKD